MAKQLNLQTVKIADNLFCILDLFFSDKNAWFNVLNICCCSLQAWTQRVSEYSAAKRRARVNGSIVTHSNSFISSLMRVDERGVQR